jgi:diguanylate cyclase (GGDEF)-like protein
MDEARPVGAIASCGMVTFTAALAATEAVRTTAPVWQAPALAAAVAAIAMGAAHLVAAPWRDRLHAERAAKRLVDDEFAHLRRLHAVTDQLDLGIELAERESDVLTVLGRAIATLFEDRENALLLAPTGGSGVSWSIASFAEGLAEPEPIGFQARCGALSTRRTVRTDRTQALDACPHAQGDDDVSSICVPVWVGGENYAVVNSRGAPGDLPSDDEIRVVEMAARRAGARIAALRTERVGHHDDVARDALTGLPNHTAASRRLRDLFDDNARFALALCDIDGFAGYNDRHGTAAGDLALRLFAEVMGATLRPGDIVARHSGDRFLAIIRGCTAAQAQSAMERVREALVLELADQELAPFTVSVGIAESGSAERVEDVVESADVAVLVAKREGGNRVLLGDFSKVAAARLDDLG